MAHSKRTLTALIAAVALVLTVGVAPASAETTYVVQPGDTLSVIARDHGVSTAELAALNGIDNHHLIRVGQSLNVPSPEPIVHTVAAGETLSRIAVDYGVSSAEIVALNELSDPNRIKVGQQLLLPAEARSSQVSTAEEILARYPSLPERIRVNPERLALVPSFERWSAHYGVPADLVMAVAYQESGWQASVVSNKGAVGVGQLMPATTRWIAADLIGIPTLDPTVPDDNIRMSARFLVWLIGYLGGEDEALAGYYQGPTSFVLKGLYEQTQAYVANVQGARARFQQG